jgi:hypothetical protein
LDDHV